jgi:CheY-like chemotaxis protein
MVAAKLQWTVMSLPKFAFAEAPVRVLVADDHPTNRVVIEAILGVLGAEVVCVENGLEAVERFKLETFEVVLMDVQMPVMDGLSAIRAIREYEAATGAPRTPVHVVSTNALPEHRRESVAAGADSHITKPISAPDLLSVVMRAR